MDVQNFIINITTDQLQQMTAFYRDVLQLPIEPNIGESAFKVGPAFLTLDTHSEVAGRTKEPARMLINFWVSDLMAEKARLDAAGVSFIRQPEREEWGGLIATFLDPDGNYLQLLEFAE